MFLSCQSILIFSYTLVMPRKHGSSFFIFVQVVDCRVCGDPNSVLRFAFIEFTDEGASNNWLFHPLRLICLVTYIISRCTEQKVQGML